MPGPDWFDKPGQPEWDNTDYRRDYSWMGIDRGDSKGDWSGFAPVVKAEFIETPDRTTPQERCELMGMVFCSCKLDNGIVIVYSPSCPVHQHFCKL